MSLILMLVNNVSFIIQKKSSEIPKLETSKKLSNKFQLSINCNKSISKSNTHSI